MVILGTIKDDGAAYERVRVFGIRQLAFAELLGNHAGLHDDRVEQIAAQYEKSGALGEKRGKALFLAG
jgi:hypothetical protein